MSNSKYFFAATHLRILILVCAIFATSAFTVASADEWKASLLPASLNDDNTLRLSANQVQQVTLALQADKTVTDRASTHDVVLEFDFPTGMTVAGNGGSYLVTEGKKIQQTQRTLASFNVQITNAKMLGAPGERLASEWQNHSFFLSTPSAVPADQSYVKLKLIAGEYSKTFEWPLQIQPFVPAKRRPKNTPIGFWDYHFSRATAPDAANGVAKLFHDSGISFTESAEDETYRKALQAQGIKTGGYAWEGFFSDAKYPDSDITGKPISGGWPDPQAIINLPPGTLIAGVKKMVEAAQAGDGFATFDFEPHGAMGFSSAATEKFKREYNISDADFETFRQYLETNGLKTWQSQDPVVAGVWGKWTRFRTAQSSAYVARLAKEFKAQMPNGRIIITSSDKHGAGTPGTLALGADNAAMSPYADIMMPQVYCGYDGAAAKLAMQTTSNWLAEIKQQNAKTKLWPLLLVRYAGATFGNTPQRLRQQILGCLAHGADGVALYYPGMLDATHWEMLARTTEEIADTEDFYHRGKRVESQFPLTGMPQRTVKMDMYPNYQETISNPDWSFTAHQLGDKILLTLINLSDSEAQNFTINTGRLGVLSAQNAKLQSNKQWQVAPLQVGFVLLKK